MQHMSAVSESTPLFSMLPKGLKGGEVVGDDEGALSKDEIVINIII